MMNTSRKNSKDSIKPFGLFIPETLKPKIQKNILDNMSVYITSSDLSSLGAFSSNIDLLIEKLKKFNTIELIQVLAKLNLTFGDTHHKFSSIENKIAKDLYKGKVLDEILGLLDKQKKLFLRSQLLSLIKLIILYHNDSGKESVEKNLEELGQIFLTINDLLESDTKSFKDKEEETKKIFTSAIRSYSFYKSQQLRYLIARYNLLFFSYPSKISDKSFSITDKYKEFTGIDIKLFMYISISIYSFFQKSIRHVEDYQMWPQKYLLSENYFKTTSKEVKREIKNILELMSEDISSFKRTMEETRYDIDNTYFSFITFKKKPLLRLDDLYLLFDIGYLEDRLTSGIYWEIFNKLEDDKEKNKFASIWGQIFELYVFDILKRCFGGSKRLFFEDDKRKQQIDTIIYYPDSLIFIEVTSKKIRPTTLVSGDYNKYMSELSDLFFGGEKSKKGKLTQLFGEINRFKNGEIDLDGIKPSSIKNYYPVIIFEDSPVTLPFFKYEDIFSDQIDSKEMIDYTKRLQLLNIEELEMLEPLINSGKSFKDLLNEKLSIDPRIPFKNFLYNSGIKEIPNEFLMKEHKDFWEKAMETLKPDGKSNDEYI